MAPKKNTTALAGSALQLLDVDPATLGVDDQVRADATPSDDLVESVLRMGVLQPPTVYWDADREQHIVVIGHRRVGAAIAAKLPSIQVLVRDAAEAKDALRLEQQLVENERRQSLTPADVARGYADLQLFGMRPEDIAAAVAERPARVHAALKATKSEAATSALDRGIDLEQAAIIAEYDDDPELQASLTTTAAQRPAEFAREANQAEVTHAANVKRRELEQQLERDGVPLVGVSRWAEPYWHGNGDTIPYQKARTLERLLIEPAAHRKCPGHAALIEDAINPERIAIRYLCTEWQEHHAQTAREETPEEIERRQETERRAAEERELEAAFKANSDARREWLRGFITGRLNQTAGLFDLIADASIGAIQHDQDTPHEHDEIAVYILTGEKPALTWDSTALADMLVDGRFTALRVLTADALATAESVTTRPGVAKYAPRLTIAYFTHLANWGYKLTELDEQILVAVGEALRDIKRQLEEDAEDAGVDLEADEDDAA